LGVQNASDFLRSKAIKGLLGEAYTPQIFEIEPTDPWALPNTEDYQD
jgi:hypothetical protein